MGVVADHGDFPVERVKVDRGGEGNWVGSVGHEEVLKLTDLREVLEDGNEDENKVEDEDVEEHGIEQQDSENIGSHNEEDGEYRRKVEEYMRDLAKTEDCRRDVADKYYANPPRESNHFRIFYLSH